MVGLGPSRSHPHIMALVDNELVVYKAFPYASSNTGHLQLRLSKVRMHSLPASLVASD